LLRRLGFSFELRPRQSNEKDGNASVARAIHVDQERASGRQGWRLTPGRYDDGAFSGASLDRPAVQQLLGEVRSGKIDVIVVYKVDRLTRSLADFAKLVELFDQHSVSFVSVTQSFNTTSSMGRLTLNVLLSFAQFEREVATRSLRPNAKESGSADRSPSAMPASTRSLSSCPSKPRRSG
jgi:DNA invertase Pin-like site-specific DNA recombinase